MQQIAFRKRLPYSALMEAEAQRPIDEVVRRYLAAIQGVSRGLRRRERANCLSLLEHLGGQGALMPTQDLIHDWLFDAPVETRRRRLTTLRRLLALTPGTDAAHLARWIDDNRRQLGAPPRHEKVIPIFRHDLVARETARDRARQARALYDEGNFEASRALAEEALESDPASMPAHAVVGMLHLEDGRPFAALQQFRQALVLGGDPAERDGIEGIPEVLSGLGRALLLVGCVDEAREVYTRLVRAGPEWRRHSAPYLGRIALLLDQPEAAADAFIDGSPLDQFNVMLARLRTGESMKASIAFYRAILENPFVPPILLRQDEHRFLETLPEEDVERRLAEARRYTTDHAEFWARWPGLLRKLRRYWDLPATRSFLMRALPMQLRSPAAAQLAVLVHSAATKATAELAPKVDPS
jgi:tetratricopeptide (TPR) repeat protein